MILKLAHREGEGPSLQKMIHMVSEQKVWECVWCGLEATQEEAAAWTYVCPKCDLDLERILLPSR